MLKYAKIIVAIGLLVCLAPMPYGYFTLIRFVTAALFVLMAVDYYDKQMKRFMVVSILLAVLFQPFVKISLGREIWNAVDILVAIFLIYLAFKQPDDKKLS